MSRIDCVRRCDLAAVNGNGDYTCLGGGETHRNRIIVSEDGSPARGQEVEGSLMRKVPADCPVARVVAVR